jgi:hypothetical protein
MGSLKQFFAVASVGSLLVGCADGTGPQPAAAPVAMASVTAPPTLLRFAAWAPRLETYDTTYLVTQGKAAADTLYFRKGSLGARMPYMVLTVPKDAQFVDASGNPVSKGTIVKLTVHADSQFVQLNFGPHGSTFGTNPATVKVSWFYTDLMGKLGSDLKLWYQPNVNTAWNPLATQVDLKFYWLVSTLEHFSNYAVAY